jgi:hypothetical protein
VAGERIYRQVRDVEGIMLLRLRPRAREREWANRMWPGAAFALEATEDDYIMTFLGYEHSSSPSGKPVTPENRGYVTPDYQPRNPSNLPGYRYVDVVSKRDGHRYRYSLVRVPRATSRIGWVDTRLSKTVTDKPAPRYGVTFEDHVVDGERKLGLASSTNRVVDLHTGDVLGELTRYAWSPAAPSRANPSPWLTAYKCPGQVVGAEAATRKFVDQVLVPSEEK